MKNFTNKNPAGKPVCFIDGFTIRHGVALECQCGVWRVDCGGKIVSVWEDDIFTDSSAARRVLNTMFD